MPTDSARTSPSDSAQEADWAIIAYGMVSRWLTRVKTRDEIAKNGKKTGLHQETGFLKIRTIL
jgi:hypothetical protein